MDTGARGKPLQWCRGGGHRSSVSNGLSRCQWEWSRQAGLELRPLTHCSPLSPHPPPPGVIALFCRQYDIIKDNEPNNNKEKTKSASETSTPEHQGGGLLRSKVRAGLGPGWAAPGLSSGPRVAAAGQGHAWPLPV